MSATGSPSLRQLRALNAVAEAGSVGAAASALGLTQPAVTQALAKLEAILGVELLRRTPAGSFLNPAGSLFMPRVQSCFHALQQALVVPCEGHSFATEAQAAGLASKLTDTHLRVLIAIWDSPSIEAAARDLEISEPSLQRSARDLEHVLGHEIFRRSMQGIKTNSLGSELARRVQLALQEVSIGLEDLVAFKSSAQSRIAIGIVPHFIGAILFVTVEEFIRFYPSANIEIREGDYDRLLSDLRAGRIDILISNTRCPDAITDVTDHPFFEENFLVVSRLDHPLALLGRPLTIQELASYSWVLPPIGAPRRDAFLNLFSELEHLPLVAVETNLPSLHRSILFKSDCLSILTPREIANEERVGFGRLAVLPSPEPNGVDVKGFVTRADWKPSTYQLYFLESLLRRAEIASPENFLKKFREPLADRDAVPLPKILPALEQPHPV